MSSTIALTRDVPAVQIPSGTAVTLKAGASVLLTQDLGGSYTVHSPEAGGLFRIAGMDADALGLEVPEEAKAGEAAGSLEEQVWERLKTCYDPEIPVNIVDLGLVYSMEVKEASSGSGKRVEVKMTLTAPGCGMGPAIAADAKGKIGDIDGISESEVEVVWEPAWNPSMISSDGKMKLGIE